MASPARKSIMHSNKKKEKKKRKQHLTKARVMGQNNQRIVDEPQNKEKPKRDLSHEVPLDSNEG